MKLTIGQLRANIRHLLEQGLDSDMRKMAGTFGGGISSSVSDREAIMNPVPGLGSPEEQEEPITDEPQKKNQLAARCLDRNSQ